MKPFFLVPLLAGVLLSLSGCVLELQGLTGEDEAVNFDDNGEAASHCLKGRKPFENPANIKKTGMSAECQEWVEELQAAYADFTSNCFDILANAGDKNEIRFVAEYFENEDNDPDSDANKACYDAYLVMEEFRPAVPPPGKGEI